MSFFPKNFLLGAATAAHQVEGQNTNSDMWYLEHLPDGGGFVEPSGEAVDHYRRYQEDLLLAKQAGLNAYRFGIEWARIEPQEGQFDEQAVAHYEQVLAFCHQHQLEPIVTLHHFSSPKWLIDLGGWENQETIRYFKRYASYIAEKLGKYLHYVCTINEANMGFLIGKMVANMLAEQHLQIGLNLEKKQSSYPTFLSPLSAEADLIVMKCHQAAKQAIQAKLPDVKVGLTLSLHDSQWVEGGEANALQEWQDEYAHYLPFIEHDEFIGVQNYTRTVFDKNGARTPQGVELTQTNNEFYPSSLNNVIRKVSKSFKGEIVVTENGIATEDDSQRIRFIEQTMNDVKACIADGLPVKGYLHWSLLDNFEWQKGYAMKFGLIAVDRTTQIRTPKPSLEFLGSFLKVRA